MFIKHGMKNGLPGWLSSCCVKTWRMIRFSFAVSDGRSKNLSKLVHPNIVRFYGLEQDDLLVYLLMEFVDGASLRTEIFRNQGKGLSNQRMMDVLQPVCSALHYAHRMGLVHCDVKPANIMLDRNGRILLTDFGIARMTEGASTMTMAGAGTPAYMSPEQIRGEEPTPQTDIYALGIVLYEMLTGGERPFTGEQAKVTGTIGEKVRWEQLNLNPTSPRKYSSQISLELEAVVMKCLEKDPLMRYAGALDLLEALQRCMPSQEPARQSQPVPEPVQRPVAPQPAAVGKTPKPWRKFQWWQFALGGGVMTLIVGGVILLVILFQLMRPGSTPESTSTPLPTLTPTPNLGVGSTQISPVDGMVMMYVPAGDFIMGSEDGDGDAQPVHTVYLDAYWIDRTEVTNAMYWECVNEGKCTLNTDWGSDFRGSQQPVVGVNWDEAQAYCTWAGRELPTEAQWEKAALGDEGRTYPWGEGLDKTKANYDRRRTTDVGSYPDGASPYGALDMAGNVWEWVADWYEENYYSTQTNWKNPSGPGDTGKKVIRGGSWDYNGFNLRTSDRGGFNPLIQFDLLGFRCLSSHP